MFWEQFPNLIFSFSFWNISSNFKSEFILENQKIHIPDQVVADKPTCQLYHVLVANNPSHILAQFLWEFFQKKNRRMPVEKSEHISLALQFVASFLWAIGAVLAGPSTVADYLQLLAAVAWCLANTASACHICSSSLMSPTKSANGEQNVEMASRVWTLL